MMKKNNCKQWWLVQLIRRDMSLHEEDVGTKQEVYQATIQNRCRKQSGILKKLKK